MTALHPLFPSYPPQTLRAPDRGRQRLLPTDRAEPTAPPILLPIALSAHETQPTSTAGRMSSCNLNRPLAPAIHLLYPLRMANRTVSDSLLREIMDDPSKLGRLPAPTLAAVVAQLAQTKSRLTGASDIPATPIDMALRHPRYRWMDAAHLHYLGDRIAAAITRSKLNGESAAIHVSMPPRHAKTHTCSIWTPFWHLAQYPEDGIILVSYEADFAAKWGDRVKRLIEMYGAEYGLYINPKKAARNDWELTTGGGMKCAGVGGPIAGNPAKLLICDDLVKNDEEARSETMRENTWDWWTDTLLQRIEPDTTTILIGTRYHEDDIIGRVLKASANGDGMRFDSIVLSAKAMAADANAGIPEDPLDRAVGEGLWLEHFPQRYYDEIEATRPPQTWSAVYQQYPSPPGGNTMDPQWWRYYRISERPFEFDEIIQTWDFPLDTEKNKRTDSYWAGLVLGRLGALIFILDSYHKHGSADDFVTTLMRWSQFYRFAKVSRAKIFERSLGGPAMRDLLRSKTSGIIPWPPKGRQKSSKEAMLNACVPDVRSGNVLLPLNPDGSVPRWVQEFKEELRQFPRSAHDDYCDAFSQGMDYMFRGQRRAVAEDHTEAKAVREVVTPEVAHNNFLHSLISKLGKAKIDHIKKVGEAEDRNGILRFPIRNGLGAGGRSSTIGSGRGRRMW